MSFLSSTLYCFSTRVDAERYTSTIDVPFVIAVNDFDTHARTRDALTGDAWRLALATSRIMAAHDVITSVQRDSNEVTFYFSGRNFDGAFCVALPMDQATIEIADALTSMALCELRSERRSAFARPRCA